RDDDPDQVFAAIESLRIPLGYLANLFTAGDPGPVERALRRLTVLRTHMRAQQLGDPTDDGLLSSVGMTAEDIEDLYRILAIAKYDERYVIPKVHAEDTGRLQAQHCAVDYPGGVADLGAHVTDTLADTGSGSQFRDGDGRVRFNLLGWNGTGRPAHLFGEGAEP
ncbi:MAG: nitrate reductase subunit beta, partial [Pseudonocardia sp.]|nr:nitrate reductase subunit beta [Pseudonocardia sp.]